MSIRFQVFISSTFIDLKSERLALSKSVLDLGHIPAGMELFPASDSDQMDFIAKVIDECDYYVLVIGGRYGSTSAAGISYTEMEYDYAVQSGKVVLAFIHGAPDEIPVKFSDLDENNRHKLNDFRKKVEKGRIVRYWKTIDELNAAAIISLNHAFRNQPQVGWVRADTIPDNATLASLALLRDENDRLKDEIAKLQVPSAKYSDAADLSAELQLNRRYKKGTLALGDTWKGTFGDIFKVIAPEFNAPKTSVVAKIEVQNYFKKQLMSIEASIEDEDVEQFLVQFVVLNLMSMHTAQSVSKSTHTYYQLTEYGRSTWLKLVYRKTLPE